MTLGVQCYAHTLGNRLSSYGVGMLADVVVGRVQLEVAQLAVKLLAAAEMAGGGKKVVVGDAAGVSRPTLDRWLGEVPAAASAASSAHVVPVSVSVLVAGEARPAVLVGRWSADVAGEVGLWLAGELAELGAAAVAGGADAGEVRVELTIA